MSSRLDFIPWNVEGDSWVEMSLRSKGMGLSSKLYQKLITGQIMLRVEAVIR